MKIQLLVKYSLLMFVIAANAKVDGGLQNKLSNELTPFGAQKQGNGKDIPEWTGKAIEIGDEPALFVIDFNNYQNYKDNLTEGQIALFEHYKETFKIPVYPTQRTSIAPDWVYENTIENAITAELNQNQTGFEKAKAGIPFPIPQSGLEAYFNHVSRWRGLQLESRASDAVVFKNGNFTTSTRESLVRFDGYIEDSQSKYFLSVIGKSVAPATKSGNGVLVLEPLDQVNEARVAWIWDKGRRRVVRAPNVAYDSPVTDASSLRTVDDTDLINGAPDRFNWQLLEKKEIYIPYNNEALSSKNLTYKDILQTGHINPDHTRYELHRVWVIEATLKDEWRHVYSKRRFYLDEDSWQVVAADQYNKQGDLWRVSLSYPKYYADMPGMFPVINVFHDLTSQQYHVMGLQNEEEKEHVFNGELAKDGTFTPNGFKMYMR